MVNVHKLQNRHKLQPGDTIDLQRLDKTGGRSSQRFLSSWNNPAPDSAVFPLFLLSLVGVVVTVGSLFALQQWFNEQSWSTHNRNTYGFVLLLALMLFGAVGVSKRHGGWTG